MSPITRIAFAAMLALSACASQLGGPIGAPVPTHPEMTFIDADGCAWWVIGNASSFEWAPQTNARGEHVCSETTGPLSDPNPGVPFVTAASPTPVVAPPADGTGARFVQVATFAVADNARDAAAAFGRRDLPVRPSSTSLGSDGFYRLVLGPFSDETDVAAALDAARSDGYTDAFAYTR